MTDELDQPLDKSVQPGKSLDLSKADVDDLATLYDKASEKHMTDLITKIGDEAFSRLKAKARELHLLPGI